MAATTMRYDGWPNVPEPDGKTVGEFVEMLEKRGWLSDEQRDQLFHDLMEILGAVRIALQKMRLTCEHVQRYNDDPVSAYESMIGVNAILEYEVVEHVKSASEIFLECMTVMVETPPLNEMPDDELGIELARRASDEVQRLFSKLKKTRGS